MMKIRIFFLSALLISCASAQQYISDLVVQRTLKLPGDIAPSQITSDQNNYAPTNFSTATILRLSTDASRTITGLAGGADGRYIVISNVGSNALVLAAESGSSTAANRFALGASLTLAASGGTVALYYDGTASRWRPLVPKAGSSENPLSFTSPLSRSTDTISIANAAADGTTKGAATFAAADFNDSSGLISIDYTNGQAASGSTKGFLSSADWTTFNGKASGGAITGSGLTIATQRIAGRSTAGTGAFEELTASGVLDLIGSTRGSVLYRGASGWSLLSPGTSGYVLRTNGAGADPDWVSLGGGGDALTANSLAQFASTTSAQLATVLSDETGSASGGLAVFNKSPTFQTDITTPKVIYTTGVSDTYGSGSPEGAVTANVGSTYRRTDGTTATTLYIKESGTGNTGWAAAGAGGSGALTLITSGSLGSAAANIDLTSISGSYRHLKLVLSIRGTTSAQSVTMKVVVNNDTTATNYRGQRLALQGNQFYAQNAGATATAVYSCEVTAGTALANSFAGYEITFFDYSSTSKIKTVRASGGFVQDTASGNYLQYETAGVWNSTSAITQITISVATGNLEAGTSYELYGLSH